MSTAETAPTPPPASRDLVDVLADARTEAAMLRRNGHTPQADSIDRFANDVAEVMRDYLDWLTEDEAMLASGLTRYQLRARFGEWASVSPPMARFKGAGRRARRLYRRCIVPRRPDRRAAFQEGLRSA